MAFRAASGPTIWLSIVWPLRPSTAHCLVTAPATPLYSEAPAHAKCFHIAPPVAWTAFLFCLTFQILCLLKSQFKFQLPATLLLPEPKILCPRHLKRAYYLVLCPL